MTCDAGQDCGDLDCSTHQRAAEERYDEDVARINRTALAAPRWQRPVLMVWTCPACGAAQAWRGECASCARPISSSYRLMDRAHALASGVATIPTLAERQTVEIIDGDRRRRP